MTTCEIELLWKQICTFAGDIINIKDLIISTAAGPAVRNCEAQTATATVVSSTHIGAYAEENPKEV